MLNRYLLGVGVWSLVCGIVAIPSWVISDGASVAGKLIGIGAWVLTYATLTSSNSFAARWRKRRERTAIVLTYGLRMFLSATGLFIPFALMVDMMCGIVSVGIVHRLTGVEVMNHPDAIVETAAVTVIQGLLLSVATFILLVIIRAICLGVMRPDQSENQPRGFEVLPATPTTPNRVE